ncbi:hypothetical protein JL720_7692 [Aureococcus anophagefferens]|nr:hypothetical protein JL720_7692 [Aureococcus anophagefferens]
MCPPRKRRPSRVLSASPDDEVNSLEALAHHETNGANGGADGPAAPWSAKPPTSRKTRAAAPRPAPDGDGGDEGGAENGGGPKVSFHDDGEEEPKPIVDDDAPKKSWACGC